MITLRYGGTATRAVDGYTEGSARRAVERLEHIERWKTTAELDNPASSIGAEYRGMGSQALARFPIASPTRRSLIPFSPREKVPRRGG